jgi:RNA polymerase sigma-70 factor (ECF subfamily)
MARTAQPRQGARTDEDLMQRIQDDDVRAFEELYDRYSARALRLARTICGNPQRAEEALQEGFVTVWRRRGTFDCTRGSARSWLFMVVHFSSLDLMRQTRRDGVLRERDDALDSLPSRDCVERDVEQRHDAERVHRSLLRLPAAQREVIVLAYFAGLTHREIAARLRLPTGTVKGRMRLGLQKVRAEIDGAPSELVAHRVAAPGAFVTVTGCGSASSRYRAPSTQP